MDYADRSIPIEERWYHCAVESLKQEILYQIEKGDMETDEYDRMIVANLRDITMCVPAGLYGEAYEEWRDYDCNPDKHGNWIADVVSKLNPDPTFPYKLRLDNWDSVLYVIRSSPYPLFLVRNDFYGDIVCEQVKEDDGYWYFNYTVKGVPILKNWKVKKRASRIIRKAEISELE